MRYKVLEVHRSEFPCPIILREGDRLAIGGKYEGPEPWDNWYFCTSPDGRQGWVPSQVLEWEGEGMGKALKDYTAQELDVDEGDILTATVALNGWLWCCRLADNSSGWVPAEKLEPMPKTTV